MALHYGIPALQLLEVGNRNPTVAVLSWDSFRCALIVFYERQRLGILQENQVLWVDARLARYSKHLTSGFGQYGPIRTKEIGHSVSSRANTASCDHRHSRTDRNQRR